VKTFVDTNVLVYAHDTDAGDRHATAKALLAQLWVAAAVPSVPRCCRSSTPS